MREGFLEFSKCPKPRRRGGVREGRSYRLNDGTKIIIKRLNKCRIPGGSRVCAKVFLTSTSVPKPRGKGVYARDVAIDLMTVPKLSKNVLKNAPSLVVGGCKRRLFKVQQMSQLTS